MFGLYELQVPMALRQKLGTQGGGGGVGGAVVLGIVAALVVSPCVGPFVAGILLYIATAGSPLLGFVILFVFALGLGTLFVIIGTFSNAINKLPGAGGWMEQVKKFFGFVLLLMAVYFLRTVIPASVTALLTGLLLLALAVFGGGFDRLAPESGFFPRLKKFIGMLSFLAAVYLLFGLMLSGGFIHPPMHHWWPGGGTSTAVQQAHIDWQEDLETGLAAAKRQNKPVLIDTWATWCVNCRVLEKETFGHPDVVAAAERFVPIKVQLEKADSPQTRAFMERFGLKQYSLPTTLMLDSDGRVQKVLPGVIGPDDMIEQMQQVH
jgi:thiol:disulfide interchange protein DsbD